MRLCVGSDAILINLSMELILMFVFGSGVLIGTQLNVANPTPINFGLVQKVSVDTSVSVKELYGQYAFPVAVGSGTRKVTCKASLARFSGQALGRLFYNQVPTPGSTLSQFAEVHSVPASAPYTITVTNSTHFVADQGVTYASTGLPLIAVASSPVAGQYSVSAAGVYTFAGADSAAGVLISYTYTSSAQGESLTIGNPLVGPTSTFSALLVRDRPDHERAILGARSTSASPASSRSTPTSRTSPSRISSSRRSPTPPVRS